MTPVGTMNLPLFRACFAHVSDAYGLETPGGPNAVRAPLTDALLQDHLDGKKRLGVYTTDADGLADQLIIDFDIPKEKVDDPKEWERALNAVRAVVALFNDLGVKVFIISSKSRGYHARSLWGLTFAGELRRLGNYIIRRAGVQAEVFPKQDQRGGEDKLGNFVWLPLHGLSLKTGKTAILDMENGFTPLPDQWHALQGIQRNSIETLAATMTAMEEWEKGHGSSVPKVAPPVVGAIPTNSRNSTLLSLGGTMRRRGMTEGSILAALREENAVRVEPPLEDVEVRRIAKNVAKYPADAAEAERFRATDLYAARVFAQRLHETFVHCPVIGGWWYYTGQRWVRDDCGEIQREAKLMSKAVAEQAFIETDDKVRAEMYKFCATLESATRLRAMIDLASTEEGIAVLPDVFDRDTYLLNTPGGTYDLRTGQSRPHDPKDLITKITAIAPDAAAPRSTFDAFLNRIMGGNEALSRFLQRFLGHCLTGNTSEHVFPICYGKGANGKTTLLELILNLLGDYAKEANFTTIAARKHSDSTYNDLAALKGARFVVIDENNASIRLNEELVKKITGSKRITARFLFHEFFTYDRAFKIVVVANHKPNIAGTDHAIWRRVKLIPFEVTIPEVEWIKDFSDKLAAEEGPAILGWLIDGCLAWQRDGLGIPDVVVTATKKYRDDEDTIGRFITDSCVVNESKYVGCGALYKAFVEWSGDRYPLKMRSFNEQMKEHDYKKDRKGAGGVWSWFGLGLIVSEDRVSEDQVSEDRVSEDQVSEDQAGGDLDAPF